MSNKSPNINPNGTTFKGIVIYARMSRRNLQLNYGRLSKPYKHMLKIIGEYIKTNYVVEYSEDCWDDDIPRASAKCYPPEDRGSL